MNSMSVGQGWCECMSRVGWEGVGMGLRGDRWKRRKGGEWGEGCKRGSGTVGRGFVKT